MQYAGGVNITCGHLYAYSERGERKRDYPNHYSEHNPWQKYYNVNEKHFKNLGSALSQGQEYADTLVIHPIRSAYANFPRNIEVLEGKYSALVDRLTLDHIAYHFGDETIMKLIGSVNGNKIKIGLCEYDKVIIPYVETIDSNTANMLREYISNGGKLCIWGKTPERIDGKISDLGFLKQNISYEEIRDGSVVAVKQNGCDVRLEMQIRSTDLGKLIFLTNVSEKEYKNTEITVKNVNSLIEIDIDSLEYKKIRGKRNADGSVTVLYDFKNSASILLTETESEMLSFEYSKDKPSIKLGEFTLESLPENMMTLSEAKISKNGGELTDERPVVRIRDNLLKERYEGLLTMEFGFTAEFEPKTLYAVVEPMNYSEIKFNGREVSFTDGYRFDRRFKLIDLSGLVNVGENRLSLTFDYRQSQYVYDVLYGNGSESLRNCLVFDTEIENIYLYGDFGVKSLSEFRFNEDKGYKGGMNKFDPYDTASDDAIQTCRCDGPFVLSERTNNIDIRNIVADGYTFFAGEMTVSTEICFKKSDPTLLILGGRYSVCKVNINGHSFGVDPFAISYELADYLTEGKNNLTLTLCFSNRNLMGPHNRMNPEPISVGPQTFSFEKEWNGDVCMGYVKSKAFVRFGIDF